MNWPWHYKIYWMLSTLLNVRHTINIICGRGGGVIRGGNTLRGSPPLLCSLCFWPLVHSVVFVYFFPIYILITKILFSVVVKHVFVGLFSLLFAFESSYFLIDVPYFKHYHFILQIVYRYPFTNGSAVSVVHHRFVIYF